MADLIPKIIEISVSGFSLVLFTIFFISIKRNSENIFFSMRSCNLAQITNLSILLSILCLTISDIFYSTDSKFIPLLSDFYYFFHLITFITLILRYHRVFISCKTNDLGKDDLLQFKFFEAKNYHYEYFYIRLMAGIIFVLSVSLIIFFFIENNDHSNIIQNLELLIKNNKCDSITEKNFNLWIITLFVETLIYLTYVSFISTTHFNPKVNLPLEIILLSIINYLYFFYIFNNFLIIESNDNDNFFKKYLIYLVPIIYNLLIYFVSIGLPFIWGKSNKTVINYDLPGELASSMYLFLTKEKCFDLFHSYLYNRSKDKRKSTFYLDMLINIFKFRMLYFTEANNNVLINELINIERNFIDIPLSSKYFEDEALIKEAKGAIENARNGGKLKMSLLDPITNVIYDYLEKEFLMFKRSDEFFNLKNELTYETYVRCKLSNYGLIRN